MNLQLSERAMNPLAEIAEPMPNHKLKIRFADIETKEFDVSPFLDKGIFKELKNESYFNQVRVSFGSVEWPNEQDFSKDTLYLRGTAVAT